ncbi:hypothetical protein QCA50_005556 [Cerrena zonata]|uniref:BTB domain-containing protein n=1 Tax=Cerrena zonata TaxID=2478898 RepID=A0AAW0G9Y7_9APHY
MDSDITQGIDRGDPWFDDGNIVIVAENTGFKVHRDVLSQRSEIFKDMLLVPQPPVPNQDEILDGIPVVHVSDTQKDLFYVISAIYNGYKYFGEGKLMTFPVIGAFLRLGNKYEIPELQRAAISRLRACFPDRLKDFRNAETTAQCAETEDEDEDMDEEDLKFNPPLIYMCLEEVIGVIDLARTHNLPSLLPAAFYLISCLPPEIVVKGGGGRIGMERGFFSHKETLSRP